MIYNDFFFLTLKTCLEDHNSTAPLFNATFPVRPYQHKSIYIASPIYISFLQLCFCGMGRKAVPFLLRNVTPEAIQMGKDVLGDVLKGRRFRESVKHRGVAVLKGVGLTRGGRVK